MENNVKKLQLFSHDQISEDAYVITENYDQGHRFTIGLIKGSERAMVIDAGLGMAGNLMAYVRSLIGEDLPVFAVFTHGHSDVLGGSAAFEKAYLSRLDQGKYPESTDFEQRSKQMGFFSSQNPEITEYGKEYALDNSAQVFSDLEDGDHFELGGACADIIAVGGHTPGSVLVRVTLQDGRHVTFCGDAFSTGMNHFMSATKQQLLEYGSKLGQVLASLDPEEDLYCTHGSMPVRPSLGMSIAQACLEVAEGKTDLDPMYMNPFARGKQQNLKTHYSRNNYIVYNADMV